MKRLVLLVTVAAMMAAMVLVTAGPAVAKSGCSFACGPAFTSKEAGKNKGWGDGVGGGRFKGDDCGAQCNPF
jgi:hypothetical protein